MKFLVVPAIMTDVRMRVRQHGETISGLDMVEVVARAEEELQGASELMLEGLWASPVTNQLKRAQQHAEKKTKEAQATARWYIAAETAVAYATTHESVSPRELFAAKGAYRKAKRNAESAIEAACQAHARADAVMEVCKPAAYPFFFTCDNCPSYSFLEGNSKVDVVPGLIPIIQVLPPCNPSPFFSDIIAC